MMPQNLKILLRGIRSRFEQMLIFPRVFHRSPLIQAEVELELHAPPSLKPLTWFQVL